MATLEQFLPYVEPHVVGMPLPGILQEIRQALSDFCEKSRVWKVKGSVSVRAGVADYEIPADDGGITVVIEEAVLNGHVLRPTAPDALKQEWPNWMAATGTPVRYTQLDPDNLTLVPIPVIDQPDGLKLRCCYKPDRAARSVPEFIFQQYAEVIAHGALARLLMTNPLHAANPKAAGYHQQQFDAGVYKALHEADKGFTRAPRRTVPRFL